MVPTVTLTYLIALALVFAVLALLVLGLRAKTGVDYGDGDDPTLYKAIRAHANFAEWVPMVVLVVAGLEASGAPATHIHWLMGGLLAARVMHPIGFFRPVGSPLYLAGRVAGAIGTWLILLVAAVLLWLRL